VNWLDWVIAVILVAGIVNGFRAGFVRLVIGMAALFVAFFAAAWFHGVVAGSLGEYITNPVAATLISYLLIFVGVIILGSLIASLIVRVFKLVGLSPVDRIMGAAFGLARASITLVIVAMIVMAFIPGRMPAAVHDSKLAPYVIGASSAVSTVTPYDIRHGVERTYTELRQRIERFRPNRNISLREE
jgi:membrane protein required for colicin V production